MRYSEAYIYKILQRMKKCKSAQALFHAVKNISPLHNLAYEGNKTSLKKFLSDYSGLIDVLDPYGRTPFMYAVAADNRNCVIILKRAGAKVNAKDNRGRTALHYAVENELIRSIKLLLTCGADVKLRDNDGVTVLHLSAVHTSAQCLKQILQYYRPEEVDVEDNEKRTALHWSACCGNIQNIKLLVKHNCNIGIPDMKGMTPLHWAVLSQNDTAAECVRFLVRNQPNVINWCDNDGQTAFHLVMAVNSRNVIEELLSCRHGNVDVSDNKFCTPLHLACLLGLPEVVNQLLNHNACIYSHDVNEATPLHYAAASNSVDTMKMILSKNVDINEKDGNDRNAVAWAASKGANEVLKTLILHGADLHAVDKQGATALHIAAAFGYESTAEILMDNDLGVNEVDEMGYSPLFVACSKNRHKMVEFLLKYGAKRDHTDNIGQTALHCAAAKGYTDVCRLLCAHGLVIDAVDIWGRTPLLCAVFNNYVECIAYLIENEANPHHYDNEGLNSLHWASRRGHLDAVKYLLSHNVDPNALKSKNHHTAVDFACLGEHHRVTHYLLEHGALSTYHIENMAATKIQRAYRKYRSRVNRSLLKEAGDCITSCKTTFEDFGKRANRSWRKQFTPNFGPVLDRNSFDDDLPKSGEMMTPECRSDSRASEHQEDLNVSEDSFQFFQENPVKTIHLNRKTLLTGSTSMINLQSNISNHLNSAQESSSKEIFQNQAHSLLHHHHSFQEGEKKRWDRKILLKNKKKTVPQDVDVGDKCSGYRNVFDDFAKCSFSSELIQDDVNEIGIDSNLAGINYEKCQRLFALSAQTQDTAEVPGWLFNNVLRKAANKEWLTSLGSTVLNRSWDFDHPYECLSNFENRSANL